MAAAVVAVLQELVKTAWYRLPFWLSWAMKLSVVDVAPAMLVNVVPPLVLTCHCTVGVGLPDAAAVNVAVVPTPMDWFAGFSVTNGAWS